MVSTLNRLAAIESRAIDGATLHSHPPMRRRANSSRDEREQKDEGELAQRDTSVLTRGRRFTEAGLQLRATTVKE
jgi:hypothetical protein